MGRQFKAGTIRLLVTRIASTSKKRPRALQSPKDLRFKDSFYFVYTQFWLVPIIVELSFCLVKNFYKIP